jgi:hypothetical protein
MTDLYTLERDLPSLGNAVLVVGLDGWIDAGNGAASAIESLTAASQPELLARFDVDALLDHRARRPVLRVQNGLNKGLRWPELTLAVGTAPGFSRCLLLTGPEPDHSWRAFSRAVVDLAQQVGCELVVGLGAFPAPAPHTRPVRLTTTATTPELAERVGFTEVDIEVPAGIAAALEVAFDDAGVPAVGLWARVPHYAAAMTYPGAAAALLDGLANLTGINVDTTEFHANASSVAARIDTLMANNDEHLAALRALEIQADSEAHTPPGPSLSGPLPSADELAAEVERYLREQGNS